jgi:hypothetical protein
MVERAIGIEEEMRAWATNQTRVSGILNRIK